MKQPTNIKQHRTISTDFKPISSLFRVLFGLVAYSFGVYLTISANIGLAPWDCLGMGIAKHTPLNYGGSMVLIGVCAIVIELILRERIGFATLFDALITGRLTQFLSTYHRIPKTTACGSASFSCCSDSCLSLWGCVCI